MTRPAHLPLAATCTFVLRISDGRYVSDPSGIGLTTSIENAYLWLWPLEDEEARQERIAAVTRRYPWMGAVVALRSRA